MRKAFTLVELLVVVGMIAVLSGTVGASVNSARKRALLSRARAEAQEITNAILSYANYTEDGTLAEVTMDNVDASKDSLSFLLGGKTKRNSQVPVLYNAAVTKGSGAFLDPWGKPYRVTVKKGDKVSPPGIPSMNLRLFYPNWHRIK